MHCLPIQSIANAFHRNGTHTIGMDTNGVDAHGVDTNGVDAHGVAAAGGRVAGTTWLFPWRIGGKTAARAAKPAPVRAAKQPLAHVRAPRDNYSYRQGRKASPGEGCKTGRLRTSVRRAIMNSLDAKVKIENLV